MNPYAVCQMSTKQSYATGKPISHMPKGASQSPKGDLGALSDKECKAAFPHPLANAGGVLSGAGAFGSGIGEIGKLGEKNSNGGVTA